MTRIDDTWPPAIPYIKPGAPVTLINWYRHNDEWKHQLVHGRLQHRTSTTWALLVDGQEHHFPIDQWALARE